MPQVTKQTANGPGRTPAPRSDPDGLLARAAPVRQVDSGGIKLSLYGRAKTGKTRLSGTFPKPVLILGAEDGTRSIRNVPDVFFVRIGIRRNELLTGNPIPQDCVYLDELGALVGGLATSRYRTVVLDTASALADLILADVMGVAEIPAQKAWGMASREQYGQQALQMKTILRALIGLPQNVVVTAHERNFNDEGGSELLAPTVGSALSPSVAGWLNGACEYICQTFIRERTESVVRKVAGKDVVTRERSGGAEYCLRVGPHPVYMTGFRLPPGQELPETIVDPTYEKVLELVNGGPAERKGIAPVVAARRR